MLTLSKAFHSKVARRVFILFVVCAIVPIIGIATISLLQVRRQLTAQSDQHLYESTKAKALSIFERLTFAERELSLLANELSVDENGYERWRGAAEARTGPDRFEAIAVLRGELVDVYEGQIPFDLHLSPEHESRLDTHRSVMGTDADTGSIWLGRRLDTGALLVAVLDSGYLWSVDDLPSEHEMAVLDAEGRPLYTSVPNPPLSVLDAHERSRSFRRDFGGESYVSSTWELPLEFAFGSRPWFVFLSLPEETRLTPVTDFMKAFPLVMLLSFWVVLLLSISQIRRSLDPLERLQRGTKRIAERDFDARVEITSGDEFEELARSFNDMSRRLGQQFNTLTTFAEIDRAVLSTLHTAEITHRLHRGLYDILSARGARITVLGSNARAYASERDSAEIREHELEEPRRPDIQDIRHYPQGRVAASRDAHPVAAPSSPVSLLLPVVVDDELAAVLAFGYSTESSLTEDERQGARQLADRFAVALANARLLEKLDRLNWGSLVALARTIDAKSPWTAGHSERAATLAVAIGRSLELSEEELDIVHRGGLLHDIGKIGIPPEILDKKGKLSVEEREVMKEHPGIGARILEPIEAYRPYIPVVLQHHEWFDGSGYPDGVAGNDISLYARIYSVADVYDALFADRPYREGLAQEEVVAYIQSRSGTQFDPDVVAGFLDLVAQKAPILTDRSKHTHRLTGAFAESPAAVQTE